MAKAKAILRRRGVVQNTRKITRTMELVSTAKYAQSFGRVAGATPYRQTLQDVMSDLARADVQVDHKLLRRREPAQHVTALLLTSNRGLCGGFNTHLSRRALEYAAQQRAAGAQVDLHVVGKKGIAFLRFRGEQIHRSYTHFGDKPTYADVEKLANEFIGSYENERTDQVAVVYQRFHSAAVQRPAVDVLLPITTQAAEGEASGSAAAGAVEYLYSPDAESLLAELLPAYFKTTLYHVFLETVVGEHRARMVAMKNATDSAEEMIKTLTRLYNRARQTQITNEISEIMGGVEALK
jgi:F-type H+-transporting ATPase subunit gamma